MDSTSCLISINTKSLIVILGLTFFFLGLIPIFLLSEVNGDSSGITKLKKLGNKIGDLDFNSGSFFGNVETCSDLSSCVGTKKDDIIYGGLRSTVFALDGDDMIYGGADSFIYGGKDDEGVLELHEVTVARDAASPRGSPRKPVQPEGLQQARLLRPDADQVQYGEIDGL